MDGEPVQEIETIVTPAVPDVDPADIAYLVEEYKVRPESVRTLLGAGIPYDDVEFLLDLRDSTATEVNPKSGKVPLGRDGGPALDKASIGTLVRLWRASGGNVQIVEDIMDGSTHVMSYQTGIYRNLGQRNGALGAILDSHHLVEQYRSGEEPDDTELTQIALPSDVDNLA